MGVCEAQRLLRVDVSSSSLLLLSPPPPRWSPLLVTQITCRPGAIRRVCRRRLSSPLLLASDRPQVVLVQLVQRGQTPAGIGHGERRRFSGSREAVLVSSLPALPVPRHSEYFSTPPGEGKYLPPRPRPVFARLQRSGLGPCRRVQAAVGQLASTTLECRGLLRSAAARAAEGRLHVAQRPRAATPTAQPRRPNPGASGTWARRSSIIEPSRRQPGRPKRLSVLAGARCCCAGA